MLHLDRLSRHYFGIPILSGTLLLCFFSAASAQIYTWKDDQGGTHYTDDPSTIPEPHQESARVKTAPETFVPSAATPAEETAAPPAEGEVAPTDSGKPAADAGLSSLREFPEAEKAVFESTKAFLKADATRYEEFYERPRHFRMTFVQLHRKVLDSVPEKKTAISRLESFADNELFKEIAGFLSQTLAEDEKATTMGLVQTLRTSATLERVKRDAVTKNNFISRLEADMKLREDEAKKKQEQLAAPKKLESVPEKPAESSGS